MQLNIVGNRKFYEKYVTGYKDKYLKQLISKKELNTINSYWNLLTLKLEQVKPRL